MKEEPEYNDLLRHVYTYVNVKFVKGKVLMCYYKKLYTLKFISVLKNCDMQWNSKIRFDSGIA
jgi:hypothetical protein